MVAFAPAPRSRTPRPHHDRGSLVRADPGRGTRTSPRWRPGTIPCAAGWSRSRRGCGAETPSTVGRL